MQRPVLSVIILFFISGCFAPKDKYSKLWLYTNYTGTLPDGTGIIPPTSFLLLQEDGSFTQDFGEFNFGHYTVKKDSIILTNQNNIVLAYFATSNGKEMRLQGADHVMVNFESKDIPKNNFENPFSESNNKWRIKAATKESTAQLTSRLHNHCRFWEVYFSWGLANQLNIIDVRSTPTPIKIYGNGFTLKPFDNLPAKWKSYFFDEEDCRNANDILELIIKNNTVTWVQTDNKFKMFISAFQQMEGFLQSPQVQLRKIKTAAPAPHY